MRTRLWLSLVNVIPKDQSSLCLVAFGNDRQEYPAETEASPLIGLRHLMRLNQH
jgi:hypothetical protein